MNPWWYKLFRAGYLCCCEVHARYYFTVVYDIGDEGETMYRLSLS
jgi:hypothetical protein